MQNKQSCHKFDIFNKFSSSSSSLNKRFSQIIPYTWPDWAFVDKYLSTSVTGLGGLLHFGLLFKACGNNFFAQIAQIFRQFFIGVKIFYFSNEIIFGQI